MGMFIFFFCLSVLWCRFVSGCHSPWLDDRILGSALNILRTVRVTYFTLWSQTSCICDVKCLCVLFVLITVLRLPRSTKSKSCDDLDRLGWTSDDSPEAHLPDFWETTGTDLKVPCNSRYTRNDILHRELSPEQHDACEILDQTEMHGFYLKRRR